MQAGRHGIRSAVMVRWAILDPKVHSACPFPIEQRAWPATGYGQDDTVVRPRPKTVPIERRLHNNSHEAYNDELGKGRHCWQLAHPTPRNRTRGATAQLPGSTASLPAAPPASAAGLAS